MNTFQQPTIESIDINYPDYNNPYELARMWRTFLDLDMLKSTPKPAFTTISTFRGKEASLLHYGVELCNTSWLSFDMPIATKGLVSKDICLSINIMLHRDEFRGNVTIQPFLDIWGPKWNTNWNLDLSYEIPIDETVECKFNNFDDKITYNKWLIVTVIEYSKHIMSIVHESIPDKNS